MIISPFRFPSVFVVIVVIHPNKLHSSPLNLSEGRLLLSNDTATFISTVLRGSTQVHCIMTSAGPLGNLNRHDGNAIENVTEKVKFVIIPTRSICPMWPN